MTGGNWSSGIAIPAIACLLLTGCAAQPKFEIRKIADPATKIRENGGSLGEAHAMLALGNPGIALEAFRKVQRASPGADALAGIAQCYQAMGRLDLARTNFEAALAYDPHSSAILTQLAAVLDRQGNHEAAMAARADAARPQVAVMQAPTASVTVPLPPATVADATSVTSPALAILAERGSITVALPPARPAAPRVDSRGLAAAVGISEQPTPRLERLSPGEVALVTTSAPLWAKLERPSASSMAMIKPRELAPTKAKILVLNAARRHRLAASARAMLRTRGWRQIEIGDSDQVRARTLVLYPANQPAIGLRLAAQFGARAAVGRSDRVVILLGRDSRLTRSVKRG